MRNGRGGFIPALALAAGLATGLTACVDGPPMPTPIETSNPTPTGVEATPSPTESPAPPAEIHLDGTAAQNKAYFDKVNKANAKAGHRGGRSFIDALIAAGYSKDAMEVTPDRTSINLQADNYQFSVLLNGTCLVGQYGATGYASYAGPVLASGHCLIGKTRPIDW